MSTKRCTAWLAMYIISLIGCYYCLYLQQFVLEPTTTSTMETMCVPINQTFDATFPTGFPQKLRIGKYYNESGGSFITQDFWYDIVDNKRTFFLRPVEQDYPSIKNLRKWIQTQSHPITLVMNNQQDKSWPSKKEDMEEYKHLLAEPNIHAIYAGNPRTFKEYLKLKPIPIGLKWNWHHRQLFSEPKNDKTKQMSTYLATTPKEAETLFRSKERTTTVYIRGMSNTNGGNNYDKDTPALKTQRNKIYAQIKKNASKSLIMSFKKIPQEEFFKALHKNKFIVSPAGAGLDTHGTWEALCAGCIPIVPQSSLDAMFEELPVWLVNNWDEVTDFNIQKKAKEMQEKKYNWEKLFVSFWKKEIYRGLCTM